MKKKEKSIQIILILFGLFLIIGTYLYYPYVNDLKTGNKQTEPGLDDPNNFLLNVDQNTSFEKVEYNGLYNYNKPFVVKSDKAHILTSDPEIVHMINMNVILDLGEGRIVNILSDKGLYNKITYDCFFIENVRATDGETQIYSQNLDLLAARSFVEIYNEVQLNYPTGSLRADKIDYDFEKKFFTVSMFDDDKVKIRVIK
ncbi:MAG: hypothetical protein FD546_000285 [Pelagibacterales bacterium]|nr:hypothetical protein [Pelagibacterales bacterium]